MEIPFPIHSMQARILRRFIFQLAKTLWDLTSAEKYLPKDNVADPQSGCSGINKEIIVQWS